jgi:1-acyl-sn-glycerol-3-phosphate acyltransferase
MQDCRLMLRLVAVLAAFAFLTLSLLPLQALALVLRLRLRRRIPMLYHGALCRLLGVRLHVVGRPASEGPLLLVVNHASWLDIPVLSAIAPVSFVAKREVGEWPGIGQLARLQRSLFVDRERRHMVGTTTGVMAARLADRDILVLFAEGTSNDGNRVLPFRSSLFAAAAKAIGGTQVPIQPVSIAYVGLNGLPSGRQHRPHLAWYGAMDLFPHLAKVIRAGPVDVRVTFGTPLRLDSKAERKVLARSLETAVRRMTAAALRLPLPGTRDRRVD